MLFQYSLFTGVTAPQLLVPTPTTFGSSTTNFGSRTNNVWFQHHNFWFQHHKFWFQHHNFWFQHHIFWFQHHNFWFQHQQLLVPAPQLLVPAPKLLVPASTTFGSNTTTSGSSTNNFWFQHHNFWLHAVHLAFTTAKNARLRTAYYLLNPSDTDTNIEHLPIADIAHRESIHMWEGQLISLTHIAWQVHVCTPNRLYLFPFNISTSQRSTTCLSSHLLGCLVRDLNYGPWPVTKLCIKRHVKGGGGVMQRPPPQTET